MIRLGTATRDITPTRPALIQGQKHARLGQTALDPITVTAWALGDATDHAVLVSCDLAFPSDALYVAVRAQLAANLPEINPDAVILLATHTHTSLVLEDGFYPHPGGEVMTAAECESLVASKIVEAVIQAWGSRRDHILRRAFGHAVVGHNRYAVYANGEGQMYGKTRRDDFSHIGGYEDHSVDMLFAWDAAGRLSGVLLVLPCPSQVDEHLREFSADYWHEMRAELRQRLDDGAGSTDLSILGLCGAAGDQSPHFLLHGDEEQEMRQRRGLSERQEIAERVADAVERALACTPPVDTASVLRHQWRNLALSPRRISQKERDWSAAAYEDAVSKGDTDSWWPTGLRRVVETFDGLRQSPPVATEIHAVRIDDLVLTTNPFELFLDYGLRIKARSPAQQTLVVQLAGRGMYLPTARAVEAGSYGALPVVTPVGPEGGAELVEETLALIADVYPEDPQP
jgi:hypothetical protein